MATTENDSALPRFPDVPDFSGLDGRRREMFWSLSDAEIDRMARFGENRSFDDGDLLCEVGKPAVGMFVIVSGTVAISCRDAMGRSVPIVERGRGYFLAEVGQLAGARSFVDGRASGRVETVLLRPEGLRSLFVVEAELGDRILRTLILRRVGAMSLGLGGPMLIGPPEHPRLRLLQEFLLRIGHPHRLLDPATDADAADLIRRHAPPPEDLPLVICPDGSVLRNPGDIALGRYLDLLPNSVRERGYDVAVVGAGPAGLATAVYAASEGLSVLVIDGRGFGGQAGASARIENYFGFPTGITGQTLTGRGFNQAQKFGAEFAIPAVATRLSREQSGGPGLCLHLEDGRTVLARTVVVASGARYRRPVVQALDEFEGRGVSYWASPPEARACRGTDVVLVGAGNSAGQAAVYLSGHAARVLMLIRGPSLSSSMSHYLVERIAATSNIHQFPHCELTALLAGEHGELETVCWKDRRTDVEVRRQVGHVFLFVGAVPATEWLQGSDVALDAKGFVRTGGALGAEDLDPVARQEPPLALETSMPGVFCVGDVRHGSVKRVGGAIGEGAAVVAELHAYLSALGQRVMRATQSPAGG